MRDIDLSALKLALSDVPGISTLNLTNIGGRSVFGLSGKVIAVDPSKTIAEVEADLRKAVAFYGSQAAAASSPQPKATTMTTPAPGSFAASLKAMLDEARTGLAQARTEGAAKVQEAVGRLNEAKAATEKVAGNMAQQIHDEAASAMSELGQISNDLG